MELTQKNLKLLQQGLCRVVFWVPWGKPSFQQIEIAKKLKSKYNLFLLNVEENIEIARQFNICLYPTTIYFRNGVEEKRLVGFQRE